MFTLSKNHSYSLFIFPSFYFLANDSIGYKTNLHPKRLNLPVCIHRNEVQRNSFLLSFSKWEFRFKKTFALLLDSELFQHFSTQTYRRAWRQMVSIHTARWIWRYLRQQSRKGGVLMGLYIHLESRKELRPGPGARAPAWIFLSFSFHCVCRLKKKIWLLQVRALIHSASFWNSHLFSSFIHNRLILDLSQLIKTFSSIWILESGVSQLNAARRAMLSRLAGFLLLYLLLY